MSDFIVAIENHIRGFVYMHVCACVQTCVLACSFTHLHIISVILYHHLFISANSIMQICFQQPLVHMNVVTIYFLCRLFLTVKLMLLVLHCGLQN